MGRRTPLLIAAGVLLLTTVALLVLPEVLRRLAVGRLQGRLHVPVAIEDVDFNAFTGRGRVTGVVIGDRTQPIIRLPTLDLDVSYRALLHGAVLLEYVRLHDPQLFVERTGPASFNILEALTPRQGGGSGLTIRYVRIDGGRARFVDRTERPAVDRTFWNVRLIARDVSTMPAEVRPASFRLGLRIADGSVTVEGRARSFGAPPGIEFDARIWNLDPAVFEAYLPVAPRIDLAGTRISAEIHYVLTPGPPRPRHELTADVDVGALRLLPARGGPPVLAVAGVAIHGAHTDLRRGLTRIREVVLREPHLAVERAADGTVNLADLWRGNGPERPLPEAGATSLPVYVDRVRLEDGRVDLRDRTTQPDVAVTLGQVGLSVTDLGLAAGAGPSRVEGQARLDRARLTLTGRLDPHSLSGQLELRATGLSLETFEPYATRALGTVTTRRGQVDAHLVLSIDTPAPDAAVAVTVSGDLLGRRLVFGVPGVEPALFRARRLAVTLNRVALLPRLAADVQDIELAGAMLRVRREREGGLNLDRIWNSAGGLPREELSPPPARERVLPLAIRHIAVRDSRLEFVDQTVSPAFTTALSRITADVRGLGPGARPADVEMRAALGGSAHVRVAGTVAAYARPLQLALEASISGYDLSEIRPYTGEFLGYPVRRGQASVTLDYHYEAGRIQGENVLTIRRLQLGPRIDDRFRKRVGVSLRLALTMLERADGSIRLRVPVAGNLARPELGLAGVVTEAVRNTLVRAVAAPFRLIGHALTIGGRIRALGIDPIPFLPGTVTPDLEAIRRLAVLVKVLQDKPGLELQLRGYASRDEIDELERERGGEAIGAADLHTLALRRAHVIEETLVARGIDRSRLFVVSPGPDATIAKPPGGVELEVLS